MTQSIIKFAGVITGAVLCLTHLEVPAFAATLTYDFTIRFSPPAPETLPPGFPETYDGFFSYDTDNFITLPTGISVFPLTDFSFDFFEPVASLPPVFSPKTYTLADLGRNPDLFSSFPSAFVLGTVPTGTPPVAGSSPGWLLFNLNFSEFLQFEGILSANVFPGGLINSFNAIEPGVIGEVGGPIERAEPIEFGERSEPILIVDPEPEPLRPSETLITQMGEFVSVTLRGASAPIPAPPTSIPEPTAISGLSLLGLGFLLNRKTKNS